MPSNTTPTATGRHQPKSIRDRLLDNLWPDYADNIDGTIIINPTSISYAGFSAYIANNGSVVFDTVGEISLFGIFSADYDDYIISMTARTVSTASVTLRYNFLTNTNNATPSQAINSYNRQWLYGNGTSVTAARASSQAFGELGSIDTANSSWDINVYRPFVSNLQTMTRSVSAESVFNATLTDVACVHTSPQTHTGMVIYPGSSQMTGSITVTGVRK